MQFVMSVSLRLRRWWFAVRDVIRESYSCVELLAYLHIRNLKSVTTQYVEGYSTYCVYPCLAFYTLAERQAKGNDKPIRTVAGHSILGLVLWLAVLERYAYYGAEK
jgi:hypothetical protein